MAKRRAAGGKDPDNVRSAFQEIAGLVDAFCQEHLNAEHADLCRKLADKTRPQASLAIGERQAKYLGLWHRPHDWLSQFPRWQDPKPAQETDRHRQGALAWAKAPARASRC